MGEQIIRFHPEGEHQDENNGDHHEAAEVAESLMFFRDHRDSSFDG